MKRFSKLGMVLAGYAAALLVSVAVFYIYVLARKVLTPDAGGMQAFGDFLLFLALLGFSALIPSGLAMYFSRTSQKFWTVFSIASLLLATTGLIVALIMGKLPQSSWVAWVGLIGLLEVMGSPLFAVGFGISAVFAPDRRSRWFLIAAASIEVAVIAYVAFCIFVLRHWLR